MIATFLPDSVFVLILQLVFQSLDLQAACRETLHTPSTLRFH